MATSKAAKKAAKKSTKKAGAKKGSKAPAGGPTLAPNAQVLIVNIIPRQLSFETNHDSEPNLDVSPTNPSHMAASAFTPDPAGSPNAPIFISTDGGLTWTLNTIVPGGNGRTGTGDITLRFSRTTDKLYAAILRGDVGPNVLRLNVLRADNFASPAAMTVLSSRDHVDQPYLQTISSPAGAGAPRDLVFVGDNDFNTNDGRTATIDLSNNAAAGNGSFVSRRIDPRNGSPGVDAPSIRAAVHPDGTVYAAFMHFLGVGGFDGTLVRRDIVVVRDDQFGRGTAPFTALTDPDNGFAGRIVAPNRVVPFINQHFLGQERIGSSLSIAVDPRPNQSSTVYLAWADRVGQNDYTLHVRRSLDRGVTWSSSDLLTVTNATNPALAINSAGRVGFLYQQLTGPFQPFQVSAANRWETHLRRSADGISWDDLVLCRTPANTPPPQGLPYLGDYSHLLAVGRDFFGIFSANNTPDPDNFPAAKAPGGQLVYQRNHDMTTHRLFDLDGTTRVDTSIDPFFFRVRE
ncbi:MAG: hypothetical protein JOZ96_03535 [Acidobacteria bacterium]|nr:hypothetical protein [Acidobacteriota bacterium]